MAQKAVVEYNLARFGKSHAQLMLQTGDVQHCQAQEGKDLAHTRGCGLLQSLYEATSAQLIHSECYKQGCRRKRYQR